MNLNSILLIIILFLIVVHMLGTAMMRHHMMMMMHRPPPPPPPPAQNDSFDQLMKFAILMHEVREMDRASDAPMPMDMEKMHQMHDMMMHGGMDGHDGNHDGDGDHVPWSRPGGPGPAPAPGPGHASAIRSLSRMLSLSEDQQKQVKPLLDQFFQEKLKPILNPDQQHELDLFSGE